MQIISSILYMIPRVKWNSHTSSFSPTLPRGTFGSFINYRKYFLTLAFRLVPLGSDLDQDVPPKPSYERLSLWGARNYWERLESHPPSRLISPWSTPLYRAKPMEPTVFVHSSEPNQTCPFVCHLRCLLQQRKADSHTYLVWQWRLQVPALLAFRTCVFQTFFHSVIWHHHCPSRMKKKIGFHDTNCGVFNRKTVFQGQ